MLRLLLEKRQEITNAYEDVEKRELMYTASGNVNWYRHYRKQYAIWKLKKNYHISSNPISGYISKGIEISITQWPLSHSNVQLSSLAQLCPTLCDPMNRSTPGHPVHHQLPEFTQTHVHESVMPSSLLILCCPLFLLPPIPPSNRVFSNESTLHMRWPKY